ncbi:DUF4365 domain-containing protein [Acetobacterium paludosum]|uniref:DUF4365 domain-containing protein n=1 Tax=Acetobacterium paludosum TaxID=52693 RepID=UPI0014791A20|nr:DUF4365 domain-containing protein [Acetobacterium paludosum]
MGHVQTIVDRDLGWVFREQTTDDYGIDAHIEIADDTSPKGILIAVQIKSGKSYFEEQNHEGVVFRFDSKHADYWLNHSLPVIIVLFNPETQKCIWENLQQCEIDFTSNNRCKIVIPFDKDFDTTAKVYLKEDADKFSVEDIVNNYNQAIFDDESVDIFPLKACPSCGKDTLDNQAFTDYEHDEIYYVIKCSTCNWSGWTQ